MSTCNHKPAIAASGRSSCSSRSTSRSSSATGCSCGARPRSMRARARALCSIANCGLPLAWSRRSAASRTPREDILGNMPSHACFDEHRRVELLHLKQGDAVYPDFHIQIRHGGQNYGGQNYGGQNYGGPPQGGSPQRPVYVATRTTDDYTCRKRSEHCARSQIVACRWRRAGEAPHQGPLGGHPRQHAVARMLR